MAGGGGISISQRKRQNPISIRLLSLIRFLINVEKKSLRSAVCAPSLLYGRFENAQTNEIQIIDNDFKTAMDGTPFKTRRFFHRNTTSPKYIKAAPS